jgi:hypothetical protein
MLERARAGDPGARGVGCGRRFRFVATAAQLVHQVDRLSIEPQRHYAAAAGDRDHAVGPLDKRSRTREGRAEQAKARRLTAGAAGLWRKRTILSGLLRSNVLPLFGYRAFHE